MANTSKETEPSSGSGILLIVLAVLIILMALATAFFGWLYIGNSQKIIEKERQVMAVEAERDSIDRQLVNLQSQFDLLRETQNDRLDSLIAVKNVEIEALKMKNRVSGGGSAGSAKLRAEISKLKEELADLLAQIERLKAENADLRAANLKLENELEDSKIETYRVTEENTALSAKVDLAKTLKISAITSNAVRVAKNGKEKETDKSKKANKIESCFTVFENDVVEKGYKKAYLEIEDPSGKLLGQSDNNSFDGEGGTVYYTSEKEFNFTGKKVDLCMGYTDFSDLTKGTYSINVYIEKKLVAQSSFNLK